MCTWSDKLLYLYIVSSVYLSLLLHILQMTLIILDIAITYVSLPWTDLTLTSQLVLGVMGRVANFMLLPVLFVDIFYNFFRTFEYPNLTAARWGHIV